MSEFYRCTTCHKSVWIRDSLPHRCPPAWEVERDWGRRDGKRQWSESSRTVYAMDAEAAAEEWAEQHDRDGDYTIVSGSDAVVRVRQVGAEEWEVFEVSGESVPQYRANPVSEERKRNG